MTHQTSNNSRTISVHVSSEMMTAATQRARALGMDVSDYVARVLKDELIDPWRQPLPSEAEARFEKDYRTFLEEERQGKRKIYNSAEEYICNSSLIPNGF